MNDTHTRFRTVVAARQELMLSIKARMLWREEARQVDRRYLGAGLASRDRRCC